jgi:hypothetical protein
MPTILVVHEVDDVDHWLTSPKRDELFGSLGYTVRTFVDRADGHSVGLIVEGAGIDVFDEAMKTDAAADAMKYDGVRPETVRVLLER